MSLLAGLLLKRTPGLSNVHLASLSAGLTQHRHKQWAVANLTLDNGETNLTHLACLPTSTAKGRVVVNSTKKFLLPAVSCSQEWCHAFAWVLCAHACYSI